MTEPDSDFYLVEKIKTSHDEPALKELIARHSGIYRDMIRKFGEKSLSSTQIMDMMDDKDFQIYQAALEYDDTKSKFSTFLALKTKYVCLSNKTRNKKNSKFVNFDDVEFEYNENEVFDNGNFGSEDPSQKTLKKEFLQKICHLIETHPDPRVVLLSKERYFSSTNGKLAPWKEISPKINLSIQGCINIHNRTIKEFQKKITNEPITL